MEIEFLELQILLATESLSSQACGVSILAELQKADRNIRLPARVYAALDRLERDGLIRKAPGLQTVPGLRGRRRSVLALTATGRQALRQSMRVIDLLRHDGEFARPGSMVQ